MPRRLKAAAGPSPDLGGYDCDPDTEAISVPAVTKVKDSVRLFSIFSDVSKYCDPLHLLLDYLAEVSTAEVFSLCCPQYALILISTMQQASDCDRMLVHDDDLVSIDGLGLGTVGGLLNSSYIVRSHCQSLESLEPDVMIELLRKSNIEIDKVLCGKPPSLVELRFL